MSDLPDNQLEVQLAFLERHVEEQDKVILDVRKEVSRLREELQRLSERIEQGASNPDGPPASEKPPHY